MTAAELKEFISEYTNEVWNKGNVEAMDRYYTRDYVHHDVSRGDTVIPAGLQSGNRLSRTCARCLRIGTA